MITLRGVTLIRFRYWALAAAGWTSLAAMWLPAGTPVRVLVVYLFMLVVPGFAMSALIATGLAERWVLTVALSATLAILVSVVMTALRSDSTSLRIALLAAVTTVASLACGLRRARAERGIADGMPKRGGS
ncbi:DUF1616 domain-containing protein [Mycolicibacterium austroafricanum]|uniref:DUF1616 domain-containing protein n=1 Tax=Mycolicibacterium austroafricanum TaxID=39687 RepID=UPI001CA34E54|nr:DUF1616 domain-containing protein [Mycolicibacterium austroafricanum]QZT62302.1 DUF1616 domain-containing protein [Mycolicibacterium austroafricanum]